MPQSTSNLLSPFLSGSNANIQTGGTTTPGFVPTTGGQTLRVTSGTGIATPVPTGINFSSVPGMVSPSTPSAKTGGTPSSVNSSGINSYGLTAASPNWYQLQPGETTANYNARVNTNGNIAAAVGTSGITQGTIPPPATGVTSPTATATYPGIVGTLASTAAQPTSQYTTAQNNYQTEKGQLDALQTEAAQAQGSIQNTPGISLGAAAGQAGQVQNLLANEEAPISQEMTADQQAAAAATAQQGTEQSGLSSAGALAAPQAANQFGTYNPQTGQYEGYGGASAGGGAASAGAVGIQVQQGAAVQQMTGQLAQAQSLATNLSSVINASGYNPASGVGPATTYANGINQWLQTNSGNPQYQDAANLISEISSRYAAILQQGGGTPTSQSQVQQQIINGLASGEQIETIIGNLQQNAQASINALNTASQSNATNGTTGNNSGGTIFPTTIQ